jgi:hypothetical protein
MDAGTKRRCFSPSVSLPSKKASDHRRGTFHDKFQPRYKDWFSGFCALLRASATWAQNCPLAAERIAKAYGLDSWGQIDAIRYTFNVDRPGVKLSRSWVWEPKADRVAYEGKDKAGNPVKDTYVRSQLSSPA